MPENQASGRPIVIRRIFDKANPLHCSICQVNHSWAIECSEAIDDLALEMADDLLRELAQWPSGISRSALAAILMRFFCAQCR
jgi:coenzyme F420-reducing hydrogenase alpha subunit